MFRLTRLKFGVCQVDSTQVWTVLDLYFACARPKFQLSPPKSGVFRMCLTYVSTVLDSYFVCARTMFWLFLPDLCMFRVRSTYVLTVRDLCFDCARNMFRLCSTIIRLRLTCVSTKLDVCFDLPDRNRVCVECARLKIGLCSTYVSPVLEPSFNSLHQNRVRFERARLMFQLFWPKVCLWQHFDQILVCSDFLGPLSACFNFLDQIRYV